MFRRRSEHIYYIFIGHMININLRIKNKNNNLVKFITNKHNFRHFKADFILKSLVTQFINNSESELCIYYGIYTKNIEYIKKFTHNIDDNL